MRLSVVTVCLNSEATVEDTLVSVRAQDHQDYEHIIVDGSSSDGTLAVVKANDHERLTWISEPDSGLYDAMNKGLRLATGDYLIFLNSNDYFARHDVLSLVAARLRETAADCLFGDTVFVREDGRTLAGRVYSARGFRKWWLRIGVMPPHPSMFVRRSLLLELGGFNATYRIAGDFDLIARAVLVLGCSWTVLPAVLTYFRIGGVSTQGLRTKVELGRELARSLSGLGQPLAHLAVQGRFVTKVSQFRWPRASGPSIVEPPLSAAILP